MKIALDNVNEESNLKEAKRALLMLLSPLPFISVTLHYYYLIAFVVSH